MYLLDLPVEILEMILGQLPVPSKPYSKNVWTERYLLLREVCHVFDDFYSLHFIQNAPLEPISRWMIDTWPIDSVIWFVRSMALHLYRSPHTNQLQTEYAAQVVTKAATRLHEFLTERAENEEEVPSTPKLLHTVSTAFAFNLRAFHPMPANGPLVDPEFDAGGPSIGDSDLLPLLASTGDIASMEALLPNTDINRRSEFFGSALYVASAMHYTETVTWLLAKGAEIDQIGGRWKTALGASVSYPKSTNVLSILIDAGADINLRNEETKQTPIMAAAEAKNPAAVEILLDQPNLDVKPREDESSIADCLCYVADAANMKRLLARYPHFNINYRGYEGTAMHWLFHSNDYVLTSDHDEIAKLLLEHGADLTINNPATGWSCIHRAKEIYEMAEANEVPIPAAVERLRRWCSDNGLEWDNYDMFVWH